MQQECLADRSIAGVAFGRRTTSTAGTARWPTMPCCCTCWRDISRSGCRPAGAGARKHRRARAARRVPVAVGGDHHSRAGRLRYSEQCPGRGTAQHHRDARRPLDAALTLPAGLFPRVTLAAQTRALDSPATARCAAYLVNQSGFDRDPARRRCARDWRSRASSSIARQAAAKRQARRPGTVHMQFRAIGGPVAMACWSTCCPAASSWSCREAEPASSRCGRARSAAATTRRRRRTGSVPLARDAADNFPDFADLREDRVVLYGTATTQVQELSYRIKATNAGSSRCRPPTGIDVRPAVQARSAAAHLRSSALRWAGA